MNNTLIEQSPDKQVKKCIDCNELIDAHARKCFHCGSYQNHFNKIYKIQVLLALLIALFSVMGLTVPLIKSTLFPPKHEVSLKKLDVKRVFVDNIKLISSNRAGVFSISYDIKLNIDFRIKNVGNKPMLINGIYTKIKDIKFENYKVTNSDFDFVVKPKSYLDTTLLIKMKSDLKYNSEVFLYDVMISEDTKTLVTREPQKNIDKVYTKIISDFGINDLKESNKHLLKGSFNKLIISLLIDTDDDINSETVFYGDKTIQSLKVKTDRLFTVFTERPSDSYNK